MSSIPVVAVPATQQPVINEATAVRVGDLLVLTVTLPPNAISPIILVLSTNFRFYVECAVATNLLMAQTQTSLSPEI